MNRYNISASVSAIGIISAAVIAASGNDGWGWFLLIGFLIYPVGDR